MTTAAGFRTMLVPVGGGTIACHTIGSGPDVLVVHGAMQAGESQTDLALLLADRYTVHLMDRRGRGASSGPSLPDQTVELDDLRAVVAATRARRLLGVSSGALLVARHALGDPSIERLVLFEPPLSIDDSMRLARTAAFDTALAAGDLGRAMAVAMRVSEMGPPWMFRMPIPILAFASRRMLTPEVTPRALALAADVTIVRANADRLDDFARITSATLLVDGTATRPYLQRATAALTAVIPTARRVTLQGEHHAATQNRDEFGNPDAVAPSLREFLA